MAKWEQLNFQDSVSPLMEQLLFLHDHIMSILILITFIVGYIVVIVALNNTYVFTPKHNQALEALWTIIPSGVLLVIASPSLRILYMTEEQTDNTVAVKVMGHQWYWSYELSNFKDIEFDSFMKVEDMDFRLLETDSFLVLPSNCLIQLFTASTDVLHSWAVPALGVKGDSSPGRLNILQLFIEKPGINFGQCSEICGANHSFMPIAVLSVPFSKFTSWVSKTFSLKS